MMIMGLSNIKAWFAETFYKEMTSTVTYSGYYTERVSNGNYSYSTFELPFDVTVTSVTQQVDLQAVAAFVIVVLVFITVVTFLRKAVLR